MTISKMHYLFAISCVFVITTASPVPAHGKIVSCLLSVQPSHIDPAEHFNIENVDLNYCSHLIYVDRSSLKGEDPWNSKDISNLLWRAAEYKNVTDLRQIYPHLKILLFIDHLDGEFYTMTTRPRERKNFVENAIIFLTNYGFDGLNLNWRYLGNKFDRSFRMLLKELKEEFDKNNFVLTASFNAEKDNLSNENQFAAMSDHLDFMHFTLLYASIRGRPDDTLHQYGIPNLKQLIDNLITNGVPSKKIVIGLRFGGIDYNVVSRNSSDLGYDQMCDEFSKDESNRWNQMFDANNSLAIAKQTDENKLFYQRIFMFENPRSVANRVRLIVKSDLGGATAILVNTDDFAGKCGIQEDTFIDFNMAKDPYGEEGKNITFPLLQTINDAFLMAKDEMFQDFQFPIE